jgi:integrase
MPPPGRWSLSECRHGEARSAGSNRAVPRRVCLKKARRCASGSITLDTSLASFLVRKGTDVKTVQKMLRHSDVATTLGIYAHSMSEDRLAAQDDMLAAMITPSNAVN